MSIADAKVTAVLGSLRKGFFTPWGGPLKTPSNSRHRQQDKMRAEIEHLVEETKQSVGLLRRHL
jgi:hypothetical protein